VGFPNTIKESMMWQRATGDATSFRVVGIPEVQFHDIIQHMTYSTQQI
jgi:hypothetical protein